ncbi:MAG: STAS domain-containing protein, partial [Cyclobacteriaceae bacterium]
MSLTLDNHENYSVFTITEEKLDSTIAPDVKTKFAEAKAANARFVIVDLTQVKYTDSSGLSALLVGN